MDVITSTNLIVLVSVVMGTLMLLIPIAGLTLRHAIKPVTEAMVRMREVNADREALALLERRLALLEQEVQGVSEIRTDLSRIIQDLEFQRQLRNPEREP